MVIRLLTYVRIPRDAHRRKITRRAVFARDRWTCQYCGHERGNLTVDHVIPRSKGGRSSWDNIVTCCAPCNRRKGDRLPRQANMVPRAEPKAPEPHDLHPRGHADDPGRVGAVPGGGLTRSRGERAPAASGDPDAALARPEPATADGDPLAAPLAERAPACWAVGRDRRSPSSRWSGRTTRDSAKVGAEHVRRAARAGAARARRAASTTSEPADRDVARRATWPSWTTAVEGSRRDLSDATATARQGAATAGDDRGEASTTSSTSEWLEHRRRPGRQRHRPPTP